MSSNGNKKEHKRSTRHSNKFNKKGVRITPPRPRIGDGRLVHLLLPGAGFDVEIIDVLEAAWERKRVVTEVVEHGTLVEVVAHRHDIGTTGHEDDRAHAVARTIGWDVECDRGGATAVAATRVVVVLAVQGDGRVFTPSGPRSCAPTWTPRDGARLGVLDAEDNTAHEAGGGGVHDVRVGADVTTVLACCTTAGEKTRQVLEVVGHSVAMVVAVGPLGRVDATIAIGAVLIEPADAGALVGVEFLPAEDWDGWVAVVGELECRQDGVGALELLADGVGDVLLGFDEVIGDLLGQRGETLCVLLCGGIKCNLVVGGGFLCAGGEVVLCFLELVLHGADGILEFLDGSNLDVVGLDVGGKVGLGFDNGVDGSVGLHSIVAG